MKLLRSIYFKLLLAFLLISSLSILLIVLSNRWLTEREFRTYFFRQDQTNIVATLTGYYANHASWQGVESVLFNPGQQPPPRGFEAGQWFFTLADAEDRVVLAGKGDFPGMQLTSDEVVGGEAIRVNGVTVGTLITRRPDLPPNPVETAFIDRIKQISMLTAAGVILLAVSLALILSLTFTRPIRELIAATRLLSAGKPATAVTVRSKDELGELAVSFNKMSADLERSTSLRRRMTADIAHELRTPLSVILGHAEAVRDGLLKPSLETFEIVRDEASRLETLIEDLRTLSRADAGELPMEFQLVDPIQLLESVHSSYRHRADQKRITLQVQLDSPLPPCMLDPGRMTQVLNNLVDNALRYTLEGGSITLSARLLTDQLELRVQDTGPGIPAGELEAVFERFHRSDPSRQHDAGSGLGLAIARSIVEKHNGRIWAESVFGQGTAILIHLPVNPPQPST